MTSRATLEAAVTDAVNDVEKITDRALGIAD